MFVNKRTLSCVYDLKNMSLNCLRNPKKLRNNYSIAFIVQTFPEEYDMFPPRPSECPMPKITELLKNLQELLDILQTLMTTTTGLEKYRIFGIRDSYYQPTNQLVRSSHK